MINRAFGLDSLDALYDYLHETEELDELPFEPGSRRHSRAVDDDTSLLKTELASAERGSSDKVL
jgi:hypothetical protein